MKTRNRLAALTAALVVGLQGAALAYREGTLYSGVRGEAVKQMQEALIALGYSSTEARNAISQIKDQTDKPEELIRLALRAMAGF